MKDLVQGGSHYTSVTCAPNSGRRRLGRHANAPEGGRGPLYGRRDPARSCSQVTCQDGYKLAFSLGEIDPGTAKGQVLVADRADGAPLDSRSGPFQLRGQG